MSGVAIVLGLHCVEPTMRSVRFPGLLTAAQALGVHRNHLYLVLTGKRTSHRLLARYHQLKGAR